MLQEQKCYFHDPMILLTDFYKKDLSRPARTCPWHLTEGDGRCRKRQQTEDKTYTKLETGKLGAWMETHQPPPSPASLLYTVAKRGGEAVLWEEAWHCNSREQEESEIASLWTKHLRKETQLFCILPTSAADAVPTQVCNLLGITMLAPFCGWGCAKLKPAVWYTCAYVLHSPQGSWKNILESRSIFNKPVR
jgi:hypothetical protein